MNLKNKKLTTLCVLVVLATVGAILFSNQSKKINPSDLQIDDNQQIGKTEKIIDTQRRVGIKVAPKTSDDELIKEEIFPKTRQEINNNEKKEEQKEIGASSCLTKLGSESDWKGHSGKALRSQKLELDPKLINSQSVFASGDTFTLDLFDDVSVDLEVSKSFVNVVGTVSTTTKVEKSSFSVVFLASTQGQLLADVMLYDENKFYAIQYNKNDGKHYSVELTPADVEHPNMEEHLPVNLAYDEKQSDNIEDVENPVVLSDSSSSLKVIADVMYIWTDQFESDGEATMLNRCANLTAYSNTVHNNSNSGIEFNMVHAQHLAYDETQAADNLVALNHLRDDGDSKLDDVFDLADEHNADYTQLLKKNASGGIGECPGNESVSSYSLPTSTHEIGHNMYLHHAKDQNYQPGPTTGISYAAGWHWHVDTYDRCTNMTYTGGSFFADGIAHTRVPYFSTPLINDPDCDVPMGDAADADNARALREYQFQIVNNKPGNHTPVITTNKTLDIDLDEGLIGLIDTSLLDSGDPDVDLNDTAVNRTFTVTTAVDNGTLFLDNDTDGVIGSGETLSVDGTFTQKDVDDNKIKFKSDLPYLGDGSESFVFKLKDDDATNQLGPENQTFNITVVSTVEIEIEGNANVIVDGDDTPSVTDHTDFGYILLGDTPLVRTFTIKNLGTKDLTLSGAPKVAVSGSNVADFTVTLLPTSPVAPSGQTTFQVTFNPSAAGTRTATLTIENNDLDEGTYNFDIQGYASDPALIYSTGTFAESVANNGSISNSIIITLLGDTFTGVTGTDVSSNIIIIKLPTGLAVDFIKNSDTQITVSLTGNATVHENANDVTDLRFLFGNGAFTSGNASVLENHDKSDLTVDFMDNNAPTAILPDTATVLEHQSIGVLVTALSTTDVDTADSFIYTLASGGDNNLFTISGSTLLSNDVFDAIDKSSYTISVTSTDFLGASITENIDITIAPISYTLGVSSVTAKVAMVGGKPYKLTVGGVEFSSSDVADITIPLLGDGTSTNEVLVNDKFSSDRSDTINVEITETTTTPDVLVVPKSSF